jgi:hypothetical protein
MKYSTSLTLVLFAGTAWAAEPEALVKRAVAVQGRVLSEFRAVKDKESAKTAHKELDKLAREWDEIDRAIAGLKLSIEDRVAFRHKLNTDLAQTAEVVRAEILRVAAKRDVIAVLTDLRVVKDAATVWEDRTRRQVRDIEKALLTFMIKNDGKPPMGLGEIRRFLPPNAPLSAPWGGDFQLAEVKSGAATNYNVWTMSPFGDGKKRITSADE